MAVNLTQFKAGEELLTLLTQHGLHKDSIDAVMYKVAQLVEEALQAAKHPGPAVQANGHKQQPAGTGAVGIRDIQSADAVLQVPFIIPRGKFEVGFFSDSMQLSNKQTAAVVPYNSIKHVLVIDAIPKQPNTTNVVLVMKSGQSVQQGKSLLDLVVIQTKDQPELDLPAPEACQHLGDRLTGAAAVVLSQLLASYIEDIQDDTFLTADSSIFSSSAGDLMIAANKGASPGWLVPLSAGLCYVGKPGSFMSSSSISKVLFHRAGGSSSTFDITIKSRPAAVGAAAAKPLELGQIDAAELNKLQGYFMMQRIKIGTDDDADDEDDDVAAAGAADAITDAPAAGAAESDQDEDEDEDDEDFDPEGDPVDGDDDDDDMEAGRPASKRQRTRDGALSKAAAALDDCSDDGDAGDSEEDQEGGDDSDDLSDVSLVNEDDMSDDDEQ